MSTIGDTRSAASRLKRAFRHAPVGVATDDTRNVMSMPFQGVNQVTPDIIEFFDESRAVVTLYAPVRNESDLQAWQVDFYRPGGRWVNARPTVEQLRAQFGYADASPVFQALKAFAEALGTITATSLFGDFFVVQTTGAMVRERLNLELYQSSIVSLVPAADNPLPPGTEGFLRAAFVESFLPGRPSDFAVFGLPARWSVTPCTTTAPTFAAQNARTPGQPLDYVPYLRSFPASQQRDRFFQLPRAAATDSAASIGLLYGGGYPDLQGLDMLQSDVFPETIPTQGAWSSRVHVFKTTAGGGIVPFPPEPPTDSETTLDVQTSMSSMVGGNVVEISTANDAEAGTVPLHVLLSLYQPGAEIAPGVHLPAVWSSSVSVSFGMSPVLFRRISQAQALCTLLGYTILSSSGDQGTTALNNAVSSEPLSQFTSFSVVTAHTWAAHTSSILSCGAADTEKSKFNQTTLALRPMNGFPAFDTEGEASPIWFASTGGFNQLEDPARWQAKALQQWRCTERRGPSMGYDPTTRGVPDVVGPSAFLVQKGDGSTETLAGTSVAAPATGGILAAIEAQRAAQGKPFGMGPLAVLLYHDCQTVQKPFVPGGANSMIAVQGFFARSDLQWDPCAGLGVIRGDALGAILAPTEPPPGQMVAIVGCDACAPGTKRCTHCRRCAKKE